MPPSTKTREVDAHRVRDHHETPRLPGGIRKRVNQRLSIPNRKGTGFARESEVQIFFGLIWGLSDFDVNREPNNGRGPVDFKVSYGSGDKSLIEFKLASNKKLEQNLRNQVEVYEAANQTNKSLKVIVFYSETEENRVRAILRKLDLDKDPSIVLIDARSDNKPSASVT